jgi:hypothetical protein
MTEPDEILPDRDPTAPLEEPGYCPDCGAYPAECECWYDDEERESEPGDGMPDPDDWPTGPTGNASRRSTTDLDTTGPTPVDS